MGFHDSGPSSNLSFPALSTSPCRRPGRLCRHSHKLETSDLWVKPFLSVSWCSQVILLQWQRADAAWGSQRDHILYLLYIASASHYFPFPAILLGILVPSGWFTGGKKKNQTLIWKLKMRYTSSHCKTTQTNSPKGGGTNTKTRKQNKKTPTFWKTQETCLPVRVNFWIALSQSK